VKESLPSQFCAGDCFRADAPRNDTRRVPACIFDIVPRIMLEYTVRQEWSTPSKEVGHDTKRGLVMPMGVSLSELSGNVSRS